MKRLSVMDATWKNLDLYDVIGVTPEHSFEELKKAYYRRAKDCHPDHFKGDPRKEAEFKKLVHAFDILSDPVKCKEYRQSLEADRAQDRSPNDRADRWNVTAYERSFYPQDMDSIMDTIADDILEEMIVGNDLPRHATLQTLMIDLQQTDRFMTFREGKTAFHNRHPLVARRLFAQAAALSPQNILYHYYMGLSYEATKELRLALGKYKICVRIGDNRMPPQRLQSIRDRMRRVRDSRGIVGKFTNVIEIDNHARMPTPEEDMIRQTNRMMSKLLQERQNKPNTRKRLN